MAAVLASNLSRAGHDVTLVVDFDAQHNADFVDAGVERVTLVGAHGRDVLRLADFIKVSSRWLRLIWRYRRIMARVVKDPAARTYFDEALRPHTSPGETDHFVEGFADKIPHTHGAPVRPAAAVAAQ